MSIISSGLTVTSMERQNETTMFPSQMGKLSPRRSWELRQSP